MKTQRSILLTAVVIGLVALLLWSRRPQPVSGPSATNEVVSHTKPAKVNLAPPAFISKPVASTVPQPAAVAAPVPLQAAVLLIVDGKAPFAARLNAAAELGSLSISPADRDALYAYLRQPQPVDRNKDNEQLKNDVLNSLCQMKPMPAGLGQLLTDIYSDPAQNAVMRDYAVQYLPDFYTQLAQDTTMDPAAKEKELAQARAALWSVAGEKATSYAGTALMGLMRLSSKTPAVNPTEVGAAALQLAQDTGVNEATQISAFQVCGQLGVKDAGVALLQAAQSGSTMPLRISAVGALGVLGNRGAVPLLTQLAAGNEKRLTLPATRALARINALAGK